MSQLFGSENVEFGPVLSSGLAGYAHELKLKDGDTVRFVPLHSVDESLGLWVHQKQAKVDGQFQYIPVGSHLKPPVASPFESDPRKEIRNSKVLRYMLVLVLEGTKKLNGHVAYLELRGNMKRTGTYDKFVLFEDQAEDSVEGYICAVSRTGSGQLDTVYEAVVTPKKREFTKDEKEVIETEKQELVDLLREKYVTKVWTAEDFQRVFETGLTDFNKVPNQGPAPKAPSAEENAW